MQISKKSILLFFAGIIVISVISVLVFSNVNKKSSTEVTSQDTSETLIPNLPPKQIAKSPDLSGIKQDLQKEIEKTQTEMSKLSEKSFQDPSGKTISLDDFSRASEAKIETNVNQSSSQADYLVYTCFKEKGERPAIGIMLQQRRDINPQQYQNLFSEMERYMKNWESTIFQDLSELFFPGEIFSGSPKFSDSSYTTSNKVNIINIRYANLSAISGRTYSIDWGFLNDEVYISNDKNCLRSILDKNADAFES